MRMNFLKKLRVDNDNNDNNNKKEDVNHPEHVYFYLYWSKNADDLKNFSKTYMIYNDLCLDDNEEDIYKLRDNYISPYIEKRIGREKLYHIQNGCYTNGSSGNIEGSFV